MITSYRQDLHKIPEIGFQEFKTREYLYQHIKDTWGIVHQVGATGLIVYYNNQKKQTIGFRTDIDALAIQEATSHEFQSQHPGFMHACGHDGHMAMMLGLFDYLEEHGKELEKNIVLVFQPSEEAAGGSQSIIESGWLQKYQVSEFYGCHLWPGLEAGKIFTRADELMAESSEMYVTVHGKAAHVASSQEGIDALQIMSRLLTAIYDYEESINPERLHLIKFGILKAGTVRNVIAARAEAQGSVRSYDKLLHQEMKKSIEDLANQFSEKYECQIDIQFVDGCAAVLNDGKLVEKISNQLPILELEEPVLQAEDFGNYGEIIPSVFFFLGIGETPALHAADFDFDSRILDKGVAFYQQLVNLIM